MSKKKAALFAATLVSIIYGVTFTIAKDVMPSHIQAYGFILLRVGVSTILFWIANFFIPKQKILSKDFPRIIAAAFFGVALNMLTFFKGLSLTTPISASVLMVSTPIIVLILSSILIKEKINFTKTSGILIGMLGTVVLIAYGKSSGSGNQELLGNFLVFVNAVSYGFYLILVKDLMQKYHAINFAK